MAKSQFDMLVEDLAVEAGLDRARSKSPGKNVVRPITKSMTLYEVMAKAGIDAGRAKPFTGTPATIHEKGVKVGDKVLVKGKKATTDKPAPIDRAEPPEHVALRVGRAIADMKRHAQGANLNGPVTEQQLEACHALARAGELSHDEVADVEKALSDKRALPLYLLKKLGSGNT